MLDSPSSIRQPKVINIVVKLVCCFRLPSGQLSFSFLLAGFVGVLSGYLVLNGRLVGCVKFSGLLLSAVLFVSLARLVAY
jgi:hypothetical protein